MSDKGFEKHGVRSSSNTHTAEAFGAADRVTAGDCAAARRHYAQCGGCAHAAYAPIDVRRWVSGRAGVDDGLVHAEQVVYPESRVRDLCDHAPFVTCAREGVPERLFGSPG